MGNVEQQQQKWNVLGRQCQLIRAQKREKDRGKLQIGTGDENRVVIRWRWVEHINLMDYAIADRLTWPQLITNVVVCMYKFYGGWYSLVGGRWPGILFRLYEIILLGYSIHYGALDLFASKSECECVQRCSVCLRCEWLWVWSRVDTVVGTS